MRFCLRALIVASFCLSVGCGTTGPSSTSLLRVVNEGPNPIAGLILMFPDGRVDFGNLSSQSTSSYKTVSGGVYGYAAFEFSVDGKAYGQPVTDWVGAAPLNGKAFTYRVRLVMSSAGRPMIETVSVTSD